MNDTKTKRIKLSSCDIDQYKTGPYPFVFFGGLLFIGSILSFYNHNIELALTFIAMLLLISILIALTLPITNKLRTVFIDDDFIYFSSEKPTDSEQIELCKILKVYYFWYPISLKSENWIIIKYLNTNNSPKRIILIPTSLDEVGNFKFNRYILKTILQKIKESENNKSQNPLNSISIPVI